MSATATPLHLAQDSAHSLTRARVCWVGQKLPLYAYVVLQTSSRTDWRGTDPLLAQMLYRILLCVGGAKNNPCLADTLHSACVATNLHERHAASQNRPECVVASMP